MFLCVLLLVCGDRHVPGFKPLLFHAFYCNTAKIHILCTFVLKKVKGLLYNIHYTHAHIFHSTKGQCLERKSVICWCSWRRIAHRPVGRLSQRGCCSVHLQEVKKDNAIIAVEPSAVTPENFQVLWKGRILKRKKQETFSFSLNETLRNNCHPWCLVPLDHPTSSLLTYICLWSRSRLGVGQPWGVGSAILTSPRSLWPPDPCA